MIEGQHPNISNLLYCPRCKKALVKMGDKYFCQECASSYPIIDGFPSFVQHNNVIKGFDASAFEFLFQMEQKHFWHIGRKEIILDILKRHVPNIVGCRMLEIGCGNGSVLAFLKLNGINIEGSDLFIEGLRYCRQRTDSVPLYQTDIMALPFHNDFDIIGLFDVLEHIDEDEKALLEIGQALKPRGKILLTVPAHKFLWSYFDESSAHKRRYGRKELITKLERNGFVIKKISYYVFFLFPLFLGIRVLSNVLWRGGGKRNAKTSLEVKTIPVVNEMLLLFMRAEKRLLRYLNFPIGASLLVLAEKK